MEVALFYLHAASHGAGIMHADLVVKEKVGIGDSAYAPSLIGHAHTKRYIAIECERVGELSSKLMRTQNARSVGPSSCD